MFCVIILQTIMRNKKNIPVFKEGYRDFFGICCIPEEFLNDKAYAVLIHSRLIVHSFFSGSSCPVKYPKDNNLASAKDEMPYLKVFTC